MTFQGFPRETVQFLHDLGDHNDKAWFTANRQRYEDHYLQPARDFVTAMAPRLDAFAPEVEANPAINKSIRRIYRDTRFSNDKRPLKDHLDIMFMDGKRGGLMLRLEADKLHLVAGSYQFDKSRLPPFRAKVARDATIQAIVDRQESHGYSFGEPELKRVPAGYEKDHPRARLLRRKGLFVHHEEVLGGWLHRPDVLDRITQHYQRMHPVVVWLHDV